MRHGFDLFHLPRSEAGQAFHGERELFTSDHEDVCELESVHAEYTTSAEIQCAHVNARRNWSAWAMPTTFAGLVTRRARVYSSRIASQCKCTAPVSSPSSLVQTNTPANQAKKQTERTP
eukprot:1189274-Prorocentrum_minimum.AAC.2